MTSSSPKPGALAATLAGLTFMLALTAAAVYIFTRHGTVFIAGLASSGKSSLFHGGSRPELSLIVIAPLAAGAVSRFSSSSPGPAGSTSVPTPSP